MPGAPTERFLVTMASASPFADGTVVQFRGEDYVAAEDIEVYVANARARGWVDIVVADTPTEHSPDDPYTPPVAAA